MKLFKKSYFENMFAKPTPTLADYYQKIADAQDKIQELRSKCLHAQVEVVMYMWRPGAFTPSRVCKECDARISDATPEESGKVWDEWNSLNQSGSSVDAEPSKQETLAQIPPLKG